MAHTNPQVGTGTFELPFEVQCLAGYIVVKKDTSVAQCITQGLDLILSPLPQTPPDPRPAGTGGTSTLVLKATVTEGGSPKVGVAVTFAVEVVAGSGGHEKDHTGVRPPGTLSKTSGTTDANGEVKLTFSAEEVAGIHKVTATCNDCSNKTAVQEVKVKVPDLSPISPDTPKNKNGTYRYSLTSSDPEHQGQSRYVGGQYYLTDEAKTNLYGLIDQFEEEGWGTVALNDASLFWGGLYDIALPGIPSHWTTPHSEHRLGEEIDISFTRAGNTISPAKQNEFYKKFCEDKKVQVPFSILHHYVRGPHFHVRLAAANRCGKTAK